MKYQIEYKNGFNSKQEWTYNLYIYQVKAMSTMKQIDGYKIYMNQVLGKGSFGAVYLGSSDKTGEQVAVKVLPKSSIDADQYLKNALFSEIKIMECIKSENVVGFYDVMESSKNYYIVQEYCDGGDLSAKMKAGQTVPENQAKDYLLQITNGFLALVKEGIIHRDLKPANIMIKNGKLKIGDFGFAKKSEATSKIANHTIVGTPLYMSLQILKSLPYSSKCDIWALGFIFYEMLHGYPPWNGKSQFDLVNKIEKKPLDIEGKFSNDTKDFIRKCLEITQEKRISWNEVFVHQIFNGYFSKKSSGNTEFENKLKMIMADLRFQINSQNLDLCKILASLGYKNGYSELDKDRFFKFLQIISPDITRGASDYIFNKTDFDKNGTISINQIEKVMNENNINLSTYNKRVPGFSKKEDNTESFTMLNPETDNRIKACFAKLMMNIQQNKTSLYDVFTKFDENSNGRLSKKNFQKMLRSVTKDISDDEITAAFDLIDEDGSSTVQFNEMNSYYSKVNNVPLIPMQKQKISMNENKMEDENPNPYGNFGNTNYNNGNNGSRNNINNNNQKKDVYAQQQQQYQQPNYGQFNPFGALMGQPYQPPQMYQPNPYYPQMMPQYPMYPPPQQQQQQQLGSGGLFDNFIFNQISQSANKNNNMQRW